MLYLKLVPNPLSMKKPSIDSKIKNGSNNLYKNRKKDKRQNDSMKFHPLYIFFEFAMTIKSHLRILQKVAQKLIENGKKK